MSRLPAPHGGLRPVPEVAGPPAPRDPSGLGRRQRDLVLLTIFVLAQHGHLDRAGLLAEALHAAGDGSQEVLFARAVLRFLVREWAAALACLEELDRLAPIERFGRYVLTERERTRRYLKARCLHEIGGGSGARDAVDLYLRPDGDKA